MKNNNLAIVPIKLLDGDKRVREVTRTIRVTITPPELEAITKAIDDLQDMVKNGAESLSTDWKHLLRCIIINWLVENKYLDPQKVMTAEVDINYGHPILLCPMQRPAYEIATEE
jgi:hypothetical protein